MTVRLIRFPYSTSSLESEINQVLKKTKGKLVSICRDGPGYLVAIETTFKGIL